MAKYLTAPIKTKDLPGGIPYIVGNEAAERFSFYGMRGILVVFMTTFLAQPGGALDPFSEDQAKEYFHLFISAAYFTPLLGGLIADTWLGKYRTILALSLVYCAGHACLAFMGVTGNTHTWLFLGLGLVALGSGGIKPCVSAHVGDQFGKTNAHWLPKVYTWFYLSINLGAFASGILTPWLLRATAGEKVPGWISFLVGEKSQGEILFGPHWAFGVPGVLMALATLVFWMGRNKFIHIQPPKDPRDYFRETFTGEGIRAMGRISMVVVFIILFWSLFDQMGSTWFYQAKELDRVLPLLGIELFPEHINAVVNPLFILLLIPVFNRAIYPAIDKVFPLTPLRKIGIGLFLATLSFAIIGSVDMALAAGYKPNIGWQILACAAMTSGEIMVSITGLEFCYTQSPKQMKSFILSMYLLAVSMGNLLTSAVTKWVGGKLDRTEEIWAWAVAMLFASLLFIPMARRYKSKDYLHDEDELGVATSH